MNAMSKGIILRGRYYFPGLSRDSRPKLNARDLPRSRQGINAVVLDSSVELCCSTGLAGCLIILSTFSGGVATISRRC